MRILIVDDSAMVRRGVVALLSAEPGWTICGEAASAQEAMVKARELRPELILLDISMPGMSGLEIAPALRAELAQSKILVMSQHDSSQMMSSVRAAQADGCIDKTQIGGVLVSAIKELFENSTSKATPAVAAE